MWSSRVWLSITALVSAAMIVWALVSDDNGLSPISFASASLIELVTHGIGLVMITLFWLYLFVRSRGGSVKIGSRFALSVCAFLLGADVAMGLLHFRVITPLPLSRLKTEEFILFVVCIALPVVIWSIVFFVTRRKEKLRALNGF